MTTTDTERTGLGAGAAEDDALLRLGLALKAAGYHFTMVTPRWPSLGPWPHLRSVADYERTVGSLVASGEMLDEQPGPRVFAASATVHGA